MDDFAFNSRYYRRPTEGFFSRQQYDQKTSDAKPDLCGGMTDEKYSGFDQTHNAGTDTTVVLHAGLNHYDEKRSDGKSTNSLSEPIPNSFVGLSASGSGQARPDESWTSDFAPHSRNDLEDFSADGFNTTLGNELRDDGIYADPIEDDRTGEAGFFVPESGYNGLPIPQGFHSGTRSLSSFGQSFGSCDDYGTRPMMGMPSPSRLTVPSSIGPSSYTASEVLSDQGHESTFPQVGMPNAGPGFCNRYSIQPASVGGFGGLFQGVQQSVTSQDAMTGTAQRSSWDSQAFNAKTSPLNFRGHIPQSELLQSPSHSSFSGYSPFLSPFPADKSATRSTYDEYSLSPLVMTSREMPSRSGPSLDIARIAQSPRPRSASTSEALSPSTTSRAAKMRRCPSTGNSNRRFTSNRPMLSSATTLPTTQKGRRQGPMPDRKKAGAKKRRDDRDTCMHCKFRKVTCNLQENGVCQYCAEKGWYCVAYHFNKFRNNESLDFVAQLYFNHPCQFGLRQWNLVDCADSFSHLEARVQASQHHTFYIRCYLGNRVLYEINLERCASFVQSLASTSTPMPSFNKSINEDTSQSGRPWLRFFENANNAEDESMVHIRRMVDCTDMTAWHTFAIVDQWQNDHERVLDARNEHDLSLLQTATLLSRLISRRLEYDGYKQLHQRLNSLSKKRPVTKDLVDSLSQLLLSLRRRLCLWNELPDLEGKEAFSERTYRVCEILYFQYFYALGNSPGSNYKMGMQHVEETVWQELFNLPQGIEEDLPTDNSRNGFVQWLGRGSGFLHRQQAQLGHFFQHEQGPFDQQSSFDVDYSYGGGAFAGRSF